MIVLFSSFAFNSNTLYYAKKWRTAFYNHNFFHHFNTRYKKQLQNISLLFYNYKYTPMYTCHIEHISHLLQWGLSCRTFRDRVSVSQFERHFHIYYMECHSSIHNSKCIFRSLQGFAGHSKKINAQPQIHVNAKNVSTPFPWNLCLFDKTEEHKAVNDMKSRLNRF